MTSENESGQWVGDHRKQLDLLTRAAQSGELTKAALGEAMRMEVRTIPGRSVGFMWIVNEPKLFGQTAARCEFAVEDFLREFADAGCVGSSILVYAEETLSFVGYEN